MSVPGYRDTPVKVPASLDTSQLKGKSVLITGGASGLGKSYAQGFAKHGAFVTVVDLNKSAGEAFVKELGSNSQFFDCDVTDWDQLIAAFEAATNNSPNRSLDVVIANAGISGDDELFNLDDASGPPKKPNLKVMDINLTGVLYTVKLAMHYFRRQPLDTNHDRCLILKSSLAGYIDLPRSLQYQTSKFGVRGLFRSLRRTSWQEGVRVNLVAPWFIETPIMSQDFVQYLKHKDVEFALSDDACKAMLLLASDKTINGRAVGIVPRKEDASGVMDLQLDDWPEGNIYRGWQDGLIKAVGLPAASGEDDN